MGLNERTRMAGDRGRAPLDAWFVFDRSPKIRGESRTVALEATHRRVSALLDRIPVTRVSNLTPLDRLALPVMSAVTPLARDLSMHLGKGGSPMAAEVSALMEAVERVSAEQVDRTRLVTASFDDLVARTTHGAAKPEPPEDFDLPSDTAYDRRRAFDWATGFDLLREAPVAVAADLVINPPREGVLVDVDTNGLASGNIHLEAVVHALCEVIERDAFSQLEFFSIFAGAAESYARQVAIDLETLPEQAGVWVERIRGQGLRVAVHDITSDIGVATFRAVVIDHAYPATSGPVARFFTGLGTHPNAAEAVLRAITEAVQARLSIVQGARDSYNAPGVPGSAGSLMRELRSLSPGETRSFRDTPSYPADDLLDDLRLILGRLRACGFNRCVAVDLTRSDLGIPVVRVRVPGLSAFAVNKRRVGPRCWRHLL